MGYCRLSAYTEIDHTANMLSTAFQACFSLVHSRRWTVLEG
jgi:hypothetical protein